MSDGPSTSARLLALETAVGSLLDRETERTLLVDGVDRLGDQTGALTTVLSRVDQQQRALARLEERTPNRSEVHDEVRASALRSRAERVRALRRALLTFLVIIPISAYTAINAHEVYRDRCDSDVMPPPPWCDRVFVGDEDTEDGAGNPLQRAVARSIEASRRVCEDSNTRAVEQANVLRSLAAIGDTEAEAAALRGAALRLEQTVADCVRLYPDVSIPASKGHHS